MGWSDVWSRLVGEMGTEWGWVNVRGWNVALCRRFQSSFPPTHRPGR